VALVLWSPSAILMFNIRRKYEYIVNNRRLSFDSEDYRFVLGEYISGKVTRVKNF